MLRGNPAGVSSWADRVPLNRPTSRSGLLLRIVPTPERALLPTCVPTVWKKYFHAR